MSLVSKLNPLPRLTRRLARRLARDRSGVAMIEFAFAAPLVLGLGMLGTETAFLVLTHMQVSQIAMQTADNASRIGATEVLVARQVFERDINEVLVGSERLGDRIRIYEQGKTKTAGRTSVGSGVAARRCTIPLSVRRATARPEPVSRAWAGQETKSRRAQAQR
jgi:Flp pilus assembly protein TadG